MRNVLIGAIVLTLAIPTSAMAVEWSLSAGAGIAPDYEGSDDYEAVPLWNLLAKDPITRRHTFSSKAPS